MLIPEIKNKLHENHASFLSFLEELPEEKWESVPDGKWTAAQQLEHIVLSVKPLRQVLLLPKFGLKLIWGKANRNSRTYDELVAKYQSKLTSGGRATGRFVPATVSKTKVNLLKRQLTKEIQKLSSLLDRFTEQELDLYVLPHPLLGKLTLREMLFFTLYHVKHHELITKRDLGL